MSFKIFWSREFRAIHESPKLGILVFTHFLKNFIEFSLIQDPKYKTCFNIKYFVNKKLQICLINNQLPLIFNFDNNLSNNLQICMIIHFTPTSKILIINTWFNSYINYFIWNFSIHYSFNNFEEKLKSFCQTFTFDSINK